MAIISRFYFRKLEIFMKENYENATNFIIHDNHLI